MSALQYAQSEDDDSHGIWDTVTGYFKTGEGKWDRTKILLTVLSLIMIYYVFFYDFSSESVTRVKKGSGRPKNVVETIVADAVAVVDTTVETADDAITKFGGFMSQFTK